jgi:AbrB family looped-hinge helix DNA binding protein
MKRMLGIATVGSKGQIVIPVEARERLGIKEGDKLLVMAKNNKAIMLINHEVTDLIWEKIEPKLKISE